MRTALTLFVVLLACGCIRTRMRARKLATPSAQRALQRFARALLAWDAKAVEATILGGARHPGWKRLRADFEARGLRFTKMRVNPALSVNAQIAVGAIGFRVFGASADTKARLMRVSLLLRPQGGWMVSAWGRRTLLKNHLRWVVSGRDPLADPGLR